jgi:hypothetical protein
MTWTGAALEDIRKRRMALAKQRLAEDELWKKVERLAWLEDFVRACETTLPAEGLMIKNDILFDSEGTPLYRLDGRPL